MSLFDDLIGEAQLAAMIGIPAEQVQARVSGCLAGEWWDESLLPQPYGWNGPFYWGWRVAWRRSAAEAWMRKLTDSPACVGQMAMM